MKKITLLFIALMSIMTINAATYLKGSFNSWGTGNQFSDGIAKITLSANQTYEFKINDGSDWYGNNGTMTSTNCTNWTFSTSDNNAKITTTIAGDYIFKWDSSTKTLSVTYPKSYYITGSSNLVGGNGWLTNEKEMTKKDTKYTYTFDKLDAGKYEFKITDGSWNNSWGASALDDSYHYVTGNDNIVLDLKKTTDLTIDFDGSKISLNLPTEDYKVYFVNDKKWSNLYAYVWADDNSNPKAWPGNSMTKVQGKTYKGYDVYEYTFDCKYKNIIFNNNSSQTSDLKIEEGKFHYYNNEWNASINYDVTFTDPSTLEFATYGKLTYQLSMPSDKWYWISLPFKVDIDKITTSTGNGAEDLVITYYDAEERATTGKGGWKNAKEQKLTTLTANQGYVIGPKTKPGETYKGITVTFPSISETNIVTGTDTLSTKPTTVNKTQDANWHIIGTGLYHNASLEGINYVALPAVVNDKDSYEYKYITSSKEPFFTNPIITNSFAPFTAFFVQHGGDYSATAETTKSAALAPVARAKAQEQEQIYLINMNEAHTVVILNAEGSEGYTAGEDFLEMNASNHSDLIYSFDGSDALAFNHRATEAQSIALGGYVATAGEQTISLNGYNANVESVTLIDNFTGETADLLAGDHTFTAEVGSLDGRFTVVFGTQKAGNTTVDCYNSTANQLIAYGSANACTVSGLTTGEAVVVYNAMGQLVFATIADSETITLPTLPTGNYLILHNGTTNKTLLK